MIVIGVKKAEPEPKSPAQCIQNREGSTKLMVCSKALAWCGQMHHRMCGFVIVIKSFDPLGDRSGAVDGSKLTDACGMGLVRLFLDLCLPWVRSRCHCCGSSHAKEWAC